MSAVGSYVTMRQADLDRCLGLAAKIREEQVGSLFWKKTIEVGGEEFEEEWTRAVIDEVDFDYSGYVLSDYLTAQRAVNGAMPDVFDSEASKALSRAFTAALPARKKVEMPALPVESLRDFCTKEYGRDAEGMLEAIQGAHEFYAAGMAQVTEDVAVVFVIS